MWLGQLAATPEVGATVRDEVGYGRRVGDHESTAQDVTALLTRESSPGPIDFNGERDILHASSPDAASSAVTARCRRDSVCVAF